jgi:hypothetical protein
MSVGGDAQLLWVLPKIGSIAKCARNSDISLAEDVELIDADVIPNGIPTRYAISSL